jgi:predicted acetyltransferase
MRDLLSTSMIENYHRGVPFFFLSPIDPTLYRNFGFEYCFDLEEYSFQIEELKSFKKKNDLIRITSENINRYLVDLKSIYDFSMQSFTNYSTREIEYFIRYLKELESEDGQLYLALKDGRGVGYISFFQKENLLQVREIFFKNKETLSTLFFLLSSYINYFDKIEIISPIGKYLETYFPNQKKIKKNILPFLMGRILNLEKIFNQALLSKNIPHDIEVIFKVSDKIILENEGVWMIQKGQIKKIDSENWDFEIGIGELSQLLLGYYSLQEMIELEKIKILCNDRVIQLSNYFLKNKN